MRPRKKGNLYGKAALEGGGEMGSDKLLLDQPTWGLREFLAG